MKETIIECLTHLISRIYHILISRAARFSAWARARRRSCWQLAAPRHQTPVRAVDQALLPRYGWLFNHLPYIGVFALQQQELLEQAFKGSSINIQYRLLLSLDPIAEALSGGAVDLGMSGTPFGAIASGQPIRVVALVEHSPKTHAILVRPNGPIKMVQDLKGKKIGGPSGKNDSFPLLVLQRAGIKDTEVEWLKLENNEGRSALLTGAIDAWRTWDPFYADVQASKEAVPLVDGESYRPISVILTVGVG
jgi:ABC-type nitrate/sulfonate/bicarbonate transport system substrate-binding protein